MAAAVPFALTAGTSLLGKLFSKKPAAAGADGAPPPPSISGATPTQAAGVTGTLDAGRQAGGMAGPLQQQGNTLLQGGAGLTRAGTETLGGAANYYRNILSNRQAASASLAPEQATALDYYRGAEGKTSRTLRGGQRDYALADLERQKVGQFANMLPQARALAAKGAEGVGGTQLQGGSAQTGAGTALLGQGVNAAATAGNIYGNLFKQGTDINTQKQEGGKKWGSLLFDAIKAVPWSKMRKGSTGNAPVGIGAD